MSDLMYCDDCERLVEPDGYSEFQGEPGHGGWIYWLQCPRCYNTELPDWHLCEECGEPAPIDEDLCPQCRRVKEASKQ